MMTKMMVGRKYMEIDEDVNNILPVSRYFKSLKFFLLREKNLRYAYFFDNIVNICTTCMDGYDQENDLDFVAQNLSDVLNFEPDNTIELDKFIVDMVKKKNYQAVIDEEANSGEEEYDVDIYDQDSKDNNDGSTFSFTKEDLIESDNEENMEEIIITSDEKPKKKNNTNGIVVV